MRRAFHALLLAAALALPAGLSGGESGLPAPGTLDGLGVNIHFTHAKPGELEQLAAAGFRWVRMDFHWGGIEREKGVYDFSAFDHLLADLDRLKLRAYFILDYGNRLYDGERSPHTDEGRAAFCAWVAAAMKRFQGRGIVWEMWNEPNIGFWKPKPNVGDYIKLALAVGRTIREIAPNETYIGPATSEVDLRFLEACFAGGCLAFWDAVSVHPYRHRPPETAADDYRTLRRLIVRHAPKDAAGTPKAIPILSGEWGYSSSVAGWGQGYDEVRQGRYLPRQWLTNLSNDVPISIWYDWHDDGADPKEAEHNFGTVRHAYRQGQAEVYEPKPAYLAARALTTQLAGFRFSKRLALADDEFVLLFAKSDQQRLVAWTTADAPRTVKVPASAGRLRAVGHLGAELPNAKADDDGLELVLTGDPVYLSPIDPNESLRLAVAWERLPLEVAVEAPGVANRRSSFTNPLDRRVRVEVDAAAPLVPPAMTEELPWHVAVTERGPEPVPVTRTLTIDGRPVWRQRTVAFASNAFSARLLTIPHANGHPRLFAEIDAADSRAVHGSLELTDGDGVQPKAGDAPGIVCDDGARILVPIPVVAQPTAGFRAGALVRDRSGTVVRTIPARRFASLPTGDPAAWRIHPDGDAKVASVQTLAGRQDDFGVLGMIPALAIDYRFDQGWKFLRVAPAKPIDLGAATTIGMWVKSDGSGNLVRLRVTDSTGQTFQPDAGRLTWEGWKWCEFHIAGPTAGHWGGANDGKPHAPLKLDTLFLLDQANPQQPSGGSVQIAGAMVIE